MTVYKKTRLPIAVLLVIVLMLGLVPAVFAAGDVIPSMELYDNLSSKYLQVGEEVEFTIVAKNSGDDVWQRIQITSTAKSLDVQRVQVNGTTINHRQTSAGKLTASIGNIAAGTSTTITVLAVANEKILETASVSYQFTVSGYNSINEQRWTGKGRVYFPVSHTSANPVIDPIDEGDDIITGTGVPGATVYVTLPDGEELTAAVGSDGTWSANVPDGTTLYQGEEVDAYQVEPGKEDSETVTEVVGGNKSYDAQGEKSHVNLTQPGSDVADIGDTIQYTVRLWNASTPSSEWYSVVTDTLPDGITLVQNSVRIDGDLHAYTYISDVLTVEVGTIMGGEEKTLTFEVTIDEDANGKKIENVATINGKDEEKEIPDPDPVDVREKTEDPIIDPVSETDTIVTGQGKPGAEVIVTFPDGTEVPAIVDGDGNWEVDVPESLTLQPDDEITAIQTEEGKDPSNEVTTNVLPDTTPDGVASKTSKNVSSTDEKASVGDIIEYTITATNNGTKSSLWPCVVTDTLPAEVTFQEGTVKIDGVTTNAYTYNAGTLTVDLGQIQGTYTKVLTFEVKINEGTNDTEIRNTADVGGVDVVDPNPPKVKEKSADPVIDVVYEGDSIVDGTGEPGAEVVVTFPDGKEAAVTVDPEGNWEVNIPSGTTLIEGEEVTAIQTEPGKDPSNEVSTIIQPNPDPEGTLTKTSENLDLVGEFANIGDRIKYTITMKNEGSAISVWNYTLTDPLHFGLDFAGEVTIDGVAVGTDRYTYSASTNTLTFRPFAISGGEEVVVTFQCTINKNAYGETITNVLDLGEDENPPKVIEQTPPPTVDPVLETDEVVSGEGVPGAEIEVTFPDGEKETTIVEEDGYWEVEVPEGTDLKPGDEIEAIQTEDGKDPSDPVVVVVEPDYSIDPSADITYENVDRNSLNARPGERVMYDGIVNNSGTESSTWTNAYVKLILNENTSLCTSPLSLLPRVNGSRVTYTLEENEAGQMVLTIPLGSIRGGAFKTFSFHVTVNNAIPDVVNDLVLDYEIGSFDE